MHSYSRELTLLGLLSATLWLPQCSLLTKVDWSIIPPAGGASSSGGSSGTIGDAGAEPVAGEGGLGGMAGDGAMAGEGGEGGSAGESEGGFGGSLAGGAGKGGSGGVGGTSGNGGSGGAQGGAPGHTTCSTAPAVPAVIPDLSQKIVLFDGGTITGGALGGRPGLHKICDDARKARNLPHAFAEAVISVSAAYYNEPKSDQIVFMAANFGIPGDSPAVVSPLGIEFASSWNTIWKNVRVLPSLVCTGVMPPNVTRWLTGSNGKLQPYELVENPPTAYYGYLDLSTDLSGAQFANACNGWVLGTASLSTKAHVGSTTADHDAGSDGHPRFIDFLNSECDAVSANILCVAYNKVP